MTAPGVPMLLQGQEVRRNSKGAIYFPITVHGIQEDLFWRDSSWGRKWYRELGGYL